MTITLDDEIACVKRELQLRYKVYPKLVRAEQMTQEQADYQMACMQAVLRRIQAEAQLPLFAEE